MKDLRQVIVGALLALGSMILVFGSLLLAVTENKAFPVAALTVTLPPKATLTPVAPVLTETPAGPGTETALTPATLVPSPTPTLIPPAACPPPPGWTPYIVLPGDTLASLAQTYGISEGELAQANCLVVGTIPAGSIIYVPPLLAATPTTTTTPIPCNPPRGWIIYTVRSGDTLSKIARSYGIDYLDLMSANCLANTVIYPGDRLWVPNVPTITPTATEAPPPSTVTNTPVAPTGTSTSTEPPAPDTQTPTPTVPTLSPTTVTVPTTASPPTVTPSATPTDTASPTPTNTASPSPTITLTLTPEPPTATLTPTPPAEPTVATPTATPTK